MIRILSYSAKLGMAIKLSLSDGPTVIESRRVAELLKFVVKCFVGRG